MLQMHFCRADYHLGFFTSTYVNTSGWRRLFMLRFVRILTTQYAYLGDQLALTVIVNGIKNV